jgi:hypothetical protein
MSIADQCCSMRLSKGPAISQLGKDMIDRRGVLVGNRAICNQKSLAATGAFASKVLYSLLRNFP